MSLVPIFLFILNYYFFKQFIANRMLDALQTFCICTDNVIFQLDLVFSYFFNKLTES